ncbi:hypothetical protein PHYSODRAFT_305158 [Phytophthora sojae]|uniref:Uncharacterized protein n=1 Tax=Phytophthora sojae (strain P6497) TaxID=1094619 RepID=G5A4Z6_PHYSP|nr:hypothetical protein PHYSODRAFT_305158 [Phytophthora sojae]EGZ09745.1 hypothetical protein PHYSODRAFT_305158 [Phytophthora sojae]|eukprot:XP_009534606.1 hypothetical protein PHYSODRAFT_305158 [Phytophthora sojae]
MPRLPDNGTCDGATALPSLAPPTELLAALNPSNGVALQAGQLLTQDTSSACSTANPIDPPGAVAQSLTSGRLNLVVASGSQSVQVRTPLVQATSVVQPVVQARQPPLFSTMELLPTLPAHSTPPFTMANPAATVDPIELVMLAMAPLPHRPTTVTSLSPTVQPTVKSDQKSISPRPMRSPSMVAGFYYTGQAPGWVASHQPPPSRPALPGSLLPPAEYQPLSTQSI